jgi:hypothetical protein
MPRRVETPSGAMAPVGAMCVGHGRGEQVDAWPNQSQQHVCMCIPCPPKKPYPAEDEAAGHEPQMVRRGDAPRPGGLRPRQILGHAHGEFPAERQEEAGDVDVPVFYCVWGLVDRGVCGDGGPMVAEGAQQGST